jgi:hypothetical protein
MARRSCDGADDSRGRCGGVGSGLYGILIAMHRCARVDLYGFQVSTEHGTLYHYYDVCGALPPSSACCSRPRECGRGGSRRVVSRWRRGSIQDASCACVQMMPNPVRLRQKQRRRE